MPQIAVFGKYWPGDSPIHRMDPRAKLLLSLLVMAIIFTAQSFWGIALCALCIAGMFRIAEIPLGKAIRSVAPLLFIVVITALLNIFFVQGGDVYFEWLFIRISAEGVFRAAFIGCRLFLLLISMSLLTLTTATLDITDAFEYLLAPTKRIGVPAHELSMIMGIALRFFPQFVQEVQTIYHAQVSRGARFSKSPFRGGLSMLTSLIVPLFTSSFRHAETLSAAMDARCYHGGGGRTKLSPLRYRARDRNALLALIGMLTAVVATNVIPALLLN